jgi:hypothetical protein
MTVSKVKCSFGSGILTEFDSGEARSIIQTSGDLNDLVFDQINSDSNKAKRIGNSGAVDVTVFRGTETVNFLETTASGNLTLTAIYRMENLSSRGFAFAVHTRHFAVGNHFIPSQYWGSCRSIIN